MKPCYWIVNDCSETKILKGFVFKAFKNYVIVSRTTTSENLLRIERNRIFYSFDKVLKTVIKNERKKFNEKMNLLKQIPEKIVGDGGSAEIHYLIHWAEENIGTNKE